MNVETLFEKFELLADGPDSIARLRELVLEFAVRGKLSHGPMENSTTNFAVDFDIPPHWTWSRLSEVADCKVGQKVPPSAISDTAWVLDLEDIDGDSGEVIRFATYSDRRSLSTKAAFDAGDVLYGKLRPYLNKVVVAPMGGYCTTEIVPLRAGKALTPHFLRVYLRSKTFLQYAARKNYGMKMPRLGTKDLEAAHIPVPPLSEQAEIVSKVDELMALCDQLEAQQNERIQKHAALARASLAQFAAAPTPANLEFIFHKSYDITPADLRKAILGLAVQGKLVPEDPNDEPAERSLPKLASVAVESNNPTVPERWLHVPLGDCGEWRGGGTPSKSRAEFWEGDIPWVSPKDMKVSRISDAQDHISKAAVEASSVRLIPAGSLLMVVRGMILARAFPVALTTREVTINQDMKALLPSEPKTRDYLLVALRAYEQVVLEAIEHSSHGTCKLKTEFLQNFIISFPPLAEQCRIVSKVEELIALVDALEGQSASANEASRRLLDAIVGELSATA